MRRSRTVLDENGPSWWLAWALAFSVAVFAVTYFLGGLAWYWKASVVFVLAVVLAWLAFGFDIVVTDWRNRGKG